MTGRDGRLASLSKLVLLCNIELLKEESITLGYINGYMAVRAGVDRALCNVKVSVQMEQHVWSGPQRVRGRLAQGYMSEDKAGELRN